MGNSQSIEPSHIDGLGLKVPDNYSIPRPTQESLTKLEQLIRANNATYGTLFNDRKFHNHLPHALVAAYYLGASPNQLTYIYEAMSKDLVPWKEDSPAVVTDDDWREFLGKREYERGYFDYFSDKIGDAKFDWQSVVKRYFVTEDEENLAPGMFGGLGHIIIHLGYAFEVDSPYIASEALTLAATNYHKFEFSTKGEGHSFDSDSTTKKTTDILEILTEIRNDTTFDGAYKTPSEGTLASCFDQFTDKIAYYTARLQINDDPKQTLKDLVHVGAASFLASHKDGKPAYSFFLLHLLTCGQAVAEFLYGKNSSQVFTEDMKLGLVRELWTLVCLVYITQMRPLVKLERVTDVNIESVESAWENAVYLVLNGTAQARTDAHFIKAVRALLFAELFLEDDDGFYARGALRFAQSFAKNPHYVGFLASEVQLDIKH